MRTSAQAINTLAKIFTLHLQVARLPLGLQLGLSWEPVYKFGRHCTKLKISMKVPLSTVMIDIRLFVKNEKYNHQV